MLPVASGCGSGYYVPFPDSASYTVRVVKNIGNCAIHTGTNNFEPTDCGAFQQDRGYTRQGATVDRVWEVN